LCETGQDRTGQVAAYNAINKQHARSSDTRHCVSVSEVATWSTPPCRVQRNNIAIITMYS